MAKEQTEATEIYKLQTEVGVLKEQVAVLTRAAIKSKRIYQSMESLARIFGEYHGPNGRKVPALITNCFPRAGTVDVFIFDNDYSGGKHEISGVYLGLAKGEMMPYLTDDEEEAPVDDSLVAAQR